MTAPGLLEHRFGLVVRSATAASAVDAIEAAEEAGIACVWMTQSPAAGDTLTTFAAAAVRTSSVRLGVAVVPAYPRHPVVLAQQALALDDFAPGRIAIGVGPSHRSIVEDAYGLLLRAPVPYMREYVTLLRRLLHDGRVDHSGTFFDVSTALARPVQVPILLSALRPASFELAGEVADGALSWVCPLPYLADVALQALQRGAERAGRDAPPLIAHVLVALTGDRSAALAAGRDVLRHYVQLPFYLHMFREAGLDPTSSDGAPSDELVESLVLSGDETSVAAQLEPYLSRGLGGLMVLPVAVDGDPPAYDRFARLAALVGARA